MADIDNVAKGFIGQRDARSRFAALLSEVPVRRRRWRGATASAGSRVVLVHGLGGSGKSSLLGYLRAMADGRSPDSPVPAGRIRTVWLDWQAEQRYQPQWYAGVEGPRLDTVLNAVRTAVLTVAGSDDTKRAFADYVHGVARVSEYVNKIAGMTAESAQPGSRFAAAEQPGSRFTAEDGQALLGFLASAGMSVSGHPGGLAGLTPERIAGSARAVGHLSLAAVQALTGRKPGDLSAQEFDLVTDPGRELSRRLAAGVRLVATRRPVVIFLDTGEVIGGRAWGWLRRVMAQTGPRVVWVVGARFETKADPGVDSAVAEFVRDVGDARLVVMSPSPFDADMTLECLRSKAAGRQYTPEDIDAVVRFTRGLPLAVSLVADLLASGEAVADVCREMDDGRPSGVVSQLAHRYLVHAEQRGPDGDPREADVDKIHGLALAAGDLHKDPELLSALWDLGDDDPLVAFQELARRYDFVLPDSRSLHDAVRDVVRTDLLHPYRRGGVRAINERARELYVARLDGWRAAATNLDEQLGHPKFAATVLSVLWHTLWTDNQSGLDLFRGIIPILIAADPPTADAAAALVEYFVETFDETQRTVLDVIAAPGSRSRRRSSATHEQWFTQHSARQVNRRSSAALVATVTSVDADPLLGTMGDRDAALGLLRGRASAAEERVDDAWKHLSAAMDRVTSNRLRQAIGDEVHSVVNHVMWINRPEPMPSELAAMAEMAAAIRPDDPIAWQNSGLALWLCGRNEDALAVMDRAGEFGAANAAMFNNRGLVLNDMQRFDEALTAFDGAVAMGPNKGRFHHNRGNVLRSMKKFDEALAALDKAIALDPNDPTSHADRGFVLREMKRNNEAVAAHERAVALYGDSPGRHNERGHSLRAIGRFDDAVSAYDQAIAGVNQNEPIFHDNRGLALQDLKRFDEALAAFDKAIALDSGKAKYHDNRGLALRDLKRFDEALAAHDKAIALDSSKAVYHNRRGNALLGLKRFDEALAAYGKAIALDPSEAIYHDNRRLALLDLKRFDDALAAIDKAIALDFENPKYHDRRARILLWELGRAEEALGAFDRAIKCDPDNARYHSGRGSALRFAGRAAEALAAQDRAIALDPDDADNHGNRGNALMDLGRLDEALAAHDHAIVLNADDANRHDNRGESLVRMGRFKDALAAVDQAISIDASAPEYRGSRGILLAIMGDLDAAAIELTVALEGAPRRTGEARVWAGAVAWNRGEETVAVEHFARTENKVTWCAAFETAELEAIALCGLGQVDEAEARLRQALTTRQGGGRTKVSALYGLLTQPPLPGIDRLRSIADGA